MKPTSPYLSASNRLADVIAAIQAMALYDKYKLDFADWSDRITGSKENADYWKEIFIQHPEFFRLDSNREKASLIWRRQYPKRFDVDNHVEISKAQKELLSEAEQNKLSRVPLKPESVDYLIRTAIEIHAKALAHQQDKRWLIILILPFIGAVLGAIIGGLLKAD